MKLKMLIYILFSFSTICFCQDNDKEKIKELLGKLNMYELEQYIDTSDTEKFYILFYEEVYNRVKEKIPVSPKSIRIVCDRVGFYDDKGLASDLVKQREIGFEKIKELALLDCQHDPYLSLEIMYQYYLYGGIYTLPKSSIHNDTEKVNKIQYVREEYYENFLKLQQLNYMIAISMFSNRNEENYNQVEAYLADVFDMSYFKLNISSENDSNHLIGDFFRLQKEAFIMLAGFYRNTNNIEMLKHLKLAHFHKFYQNPDVLPKFNEILESARLGKVEFYKK